MYDESDLLCHEDQLTDVDLDRSGECHLPRKQGSVVRRSTDVLISPQLHNRKDHSEKHLNAKSTATLREEERESSVAKEDQCVQSAKISCSANSKNYCYICGKSQSKLARHLKTHKDEGEVAQALSLPVHSKERKAMLQKLRNKGNFQHNVSGYLTVTLFPEKAGTRCCAESTMGTFFVRPVVEACVSNTPNFGLITSVR